MLNVQHAVELTASTDEFNVEAPAFIIETDDNIICEANSEATASCGQSTLVGKKLSDIIYIEKNLDAAKSPAYFNKQWFIATQKTIVYNGSPHIQVTLKDRNRIPDFEVLKSLKDMIGLLLHRVRSPLTGMQGYAGLAKNNLDNQENAHGYVNKIDDSIDQLLELLDELEKLQKVSLDQADGNYSASPERVLQNLLSDYPEDIQEKVSIAPKTKMNLLPCNPGDLQRILSILIENAVEYSDLSKTGITIDQPSQNSIRIRHEGNPIPDSIADELFAPFVTSQATKMGIGLTMAMLYAKRYNGSIFLTSNSLFTGIAFTVCFPPSKG